MPQPTLVTENVKLSVIILCMKITHSELQPHLSVANMLVAMQLIIRMIMLLIIDDADKNNDIDNDGLPIRKKQ